MQAPFENYDLVIYLLNLSSHTHVLNPTWRLGTPNPLSRSRIRSSPGGGVCQEASACLDPRVDQGVQDDQDKERRSAQEDRRGAGYLKR